MKKMLIIALCLGFVPMLFAVDHTVDVKAIAPTQTPSMSYSNPHATGQQYDKPAVDTQGRSTLLFDQQYTGSTGMLYACQWDSVLNFDAEISDNFTVPFSAFVDSVVWWGGYWNGSPTPPIDFNIRIYEDNGGIPQETPVYSERVAYTEALQGADYIYTAVIPPFSAQPGITYWIEFLPTLIFPPQWGNCGSWPANSPGWGDGQQCYFKSIYFGYNTWTPATTIWGDPIEPPFQIYGTPSATSYIWDFEPDLQGWTHTNGMAFPGGWDRQPYNIHDPYYPPDPDQWCLWIDADAYGSGLGSDTAKSPVVMTPVNMYLLKWGAYQEGGSGSWIDETKVGMYYKTGGAWNSVLLRTYPQGTDFMDWDSVDVSAYAFAESVQVWVHFDDFYSWGYYAAYDNIELRGSVSLQHDVRTVSIDAPPDKVGPGTSIDPQATVGNPGANQETFDVYFLIDSSGVNLYNNSQTVTALDPGLQTQLTFPTWTAGTGDGIVYDITVYTALAGDEDPSNDTLYSQTTVSTVGDWVQCQSLPTPEECQATGYDPDNDRIYSFGGTPDGGYNYHNYTYQYDPTSNTWATMANMPHAVDWIDASYINGNFYIFGGFDGGSPYTYNMIYNVAGNSWSNGAAMPIGRMAAGQVVYNDSLIYMLGGYNGSGPSTNVQIYNVYTNSWTTGTALPQSNMMQGVAMTGDTIWLVGGYNGSSAYSTLYYGIINPSSCETIAWATGSALPVANFNNGATQIVREGQWYLFMVGGFENASTITNHAWEYSVGNDSWTALPNYPMTITRNDFLIAREGHDEIYVCGGDPTGSWTATDQVWKLPWFTGVEEKPDKSEVASNFGFASNFPNPVNGNALISYVITKAGIVSLKVYDGSGRLVSTLVNDVQEPGTKTVTWNARNLANGVYFVQLQAEGKTDTHKMILVK